LIVDEALSVGDAYFQHKSFARMREFKAAGVAIILVTHSLADVRALCSRVILLGQGRVLKDGPPDEVLDYYNALVAQKEHQPMPIIQQRDATGWMVTQSGSGEVQIESLHLRDPNSNEVLTTLQVNQEVELVLRARANEAVSQLVLGYMLRDKHGHLVWGTNTWHTRQLQENIAAGEMIEFVLRFTCRLGPGVYAISPSLSSSENHIANNYAWVDNLLIFEVVNVHLPFFVGTTGLDAQFCVNRSFKNKIADSLVAKQVN